MSCKNLTFAICSSSIESTVEEHRDSHSVLGAVQGQKTFLPKELMLVMVQKFANYFAYFILQVILNLSLSRTIYL